MLEYEWDEGELKKAGLSSKDIKNLDQAISKLADQEYAETEARRTREMQALDKIRATHAPVLQRKLKQAGIDLKSLQAELKAISKIEDFRLRSEKMEGLQNRYVKQLEEAAASGNINPDEVRASMRQIASSGPLRFGFTDDALFGLTIIPYLTVCSETTDFHDQATKPKRK